MTAWAVSFAAACALIYLLRFSTRGPSLAKSVIKVGAVAPLAYVAWAQGLPPLLFVGLAFGAVGDAFLSRDTDKTFLFGLISFAIAHLAYVALFFSFSPPGASAWVLGVGMTVFALWMARRLWPVTGALRPAVMVYVAIIAAMGIASLWPGPPILWGALLFMVSDSVLAHELFLMRPDSRWRPWAARAVWLTYWSAQALFLGSFLLVSGVTQF